VDKIADEDVQKWASDSERPQHRVSLSEGFWLADTPCTDLFWEGIGADRDSSETSESTILGMHPITNVSWDKVLLFLQAIATYLPTNVRAFLPSEAQWEYACRAGTESAYWWGDAPDENRMNVNGRYKGVTEVKRFSPNPWGLFDMHGNVWEWCADPGRRVYNEAAFNDAPKIDEKEDWRVLRGGAWYSPPARARAASRSVVPRGHDWNRCGFRLALRSTSAG
jgi:formylglycine-generating enzyme